MSWTHTIFGFFCLLQPGMTNAKAVSLSQRVGGGKEILVPFQRMPRGQEGKQDGKGCFGKVLVRKRSDRGGGFVVASKERLGHRVSLAST